jgi:SAM-dependent methyltransferase
VLAWDVPNWSRALRYWEREGGISEGTLACLEVGANGGGLSVWLAMQGHTVVCSDYHASFANAEALAQRHGVAARLRFEEIDATCIPYESTFDIVAFKSVLGGIGRDGALERQRAAVASMHRALRPGGRLLFAENLRASPLHRSLRDRYIAWGSSWRYITIEEMRSFLEPFSNVSLDTAGFFGTFGRSEAQRRTLSLLDRVAANALVPPSWRYIVYGVATK